MSDSPDTEFERLLERARDALGTPEAPGHGQMLVDGNIAANQALSLRPDSVDGWIVKCQISSAGGDDFTALAAIEMAARRAPHRAECLYWRGAILGDLGRHREALRAIETGLRGLTQDDHWLLEDLYYEKVQILEALGLHDAAVATCELALMRCPGSTLLRAALTPIQRARVRSTLTVLRGGAGS